MTAALTIRSIRARGVDLALQRHVETASGVMRTAPLVLVDVLTEEGVAGMALAALDAGDRAEAVRLAARAQRLNAHASLALRLQRRLQTSGAP